MKNSKKWVNKTHEIIDGKRKATEAYNNWRMMMNRCYNKIALSKMPTYESCSVCDEWINFDSFKKWHDDNFVRGYHLDKDILVKGNKEYSPLKCCFVPPHINTLFVNRKASRGNLPIGVDFKKKNNKYRASCSINKKQIHIGLFDNPDDAFNAYKIVKKANIIRIANESFNKNEIGINIYNALINFEIDKY